MNTTPSENPFDAEGTPSWGTPHPGEPTAQSFGSDHPQQSQRSQRSQQAGPYQQAGPSGPQTPPGARFFDAIRRWGVVRPDPGHGRWFAGVCAGLAHRWGMSPMLVRGLFVLFGLLSGVGLFAYGVLWLLLPHPDGRIHAQQVLSGVVTGGFVGGVIAVLLNGPFGSSWVDNNGNWHHHGPGIVPLILVGLVVWWIVRRRRSHHVHHG